MTSVVFPDVETMLRARGVPERADGSFAEDSYDYGVWWRDGRGGVYRLTWIGGQLREDGQAGELYLARLSGSSGYRQVRPGVYRRSAGDPSGPVELLCLVPPVPAEREVAETISHLSYYEAHGRRGAGLTDEERDRLDRARRGYRPDETVEAILDGWADVCGLPDSRAWVYDRVWEALRAGWARDARVEVLGG